MPLSTANDGKRLTKKYAEDRAKALIHPDRFTAEELAWLDIPADYPASNALNPDMYIIETTPDDPRTAPKPYDIRKRPEVGD